MAELTRAASQAIFDLMQRQFDQIGPQKMGAHFEEAKRKRRKMRINPVANPPRPKGRGAMGYRPALRVTHYDTLQVARSADRETIQAAWKSLCVRFHPDKHPGDKRAEERTKRLNEAWDILGDPKKRASYDRSLDP